MPSFFQRHFESDILLYEYAQSSRLDSDQSNLEISGKSL